MMMNKIIRIITMLIVLAVGVVLLKFTWKWQPYSMEKRISALEECVCMKDYDIYFDDGEDEIILNIDNIPDVYVQDTTQ